MSEQPVYIEFGAGRGMLSLGIDYCLNHRLPTESKDEKDLKGKYLMIFFCFFAVKSLKRTDPVQHCTEPDRFYGMGIQWGIRNI